ncbi:unnamed protein product [Arctogadus glacialis]
MSALGQRDKSSPNWFRGLAGSVSRGLPLRNIYDPTHRPHYDVTALAGETTDGTPKEESQDPPAPPAVSQCGPHSLMLRPKGGRVLSLALHLCSAAVLCLSAQHAFTSSPVMNSEVMG